MSSAADKANVFAKNLSKNFNLDDSGIFLRFFLQELICKCIVFL